MKLPEPQVETTLFSRDSSTQFYYTESQLREVLAQQEEVMRNVLDVLGPQAPECCGCKAEWNEAIKALEDALK